MIPRIPFAVAFEPRSRLDDETIAALELLRAEATMRGGWVKNGELYTLARQTGLRRTRTRVRTLGPGTCARQRQRGTSTTWRNTHLQRTWRIYFTCVQKYTFNSAFNEVLRVNDS